MREGEEGLPVAAGTVGVSMVEWWSDEGTAGRGEGREEMGRHDRGKVWLGRRWISHLLDSGRQRLA